MEPSIHFKSSFKSIAESGAGNQIRTGDPLITNQIRVWCIALDARKHADSWGIVGAKSTPCARYSLKVALQVKVGVAMKNGWRKVNENRYVRSDGAVVMWDQRSPHPNPADPGSRMWTAWEPDPSESAICKNHYHSILRSPRRWKTELAAMKAVDRIFPPPQENER